MNPTQFNIIFYETLYGKVIDLVNGLLQNNLSTGFINVYINIQLV